MDRLRPVSSTERLTVDQERDLVAAAEGGDPEACRSLVEAFLPGIAAQAAAHRGSSVDRRELIQEGVAGLLFAARRFDPSLGTPFWAYASFWVRKAMQELVAELARPVALSDRAVRGLAAVRAARAEHLQQDGTEPTADQLSLATGLPRQQVEQLLAAERTPRSMEEQVSTGDDSAGTVGDRIPDPHAEHAFDGVLDRIEIREVGALTDRLGERERQVIRAHYGIGEPAQTLSRIGAGLGVSAERVRQIEAGGLAALRAALACPADLLPVRP